MGHTIFNESNNIDYDLKKIKLQVLISENLEIKINKRVAQLSLETRSKVKPISTYVRDLIIEDCSKIK